VSVTGSFYQFRNGELLAVDIALADNLTVADSFLVTGGSVRGLSRHLERFERSIDDEETARQLPEFFAQSVSLMPRSGDWFPRLEYRESQPVGARLFLRMRPAPERTRVASLWTLDEPDPRSNPQVKGPDLSVCQRIRRKANLNGADEAVIVDQDGYISDGALSAILWWRADTLFAPDESTPWLPSITRELLFDLASQAGYQIGTEQARPVSLMGCEVWSVSALQGVRYVNSWGDLTLAEPKKYSPFAKRLALLNESLPKL